MGRRKKRSALSDVQTYVSVKCKEQSAKGKEVMFWKLLLKTKALISL